MDIGEEIDVASYEEGESAHVALITTLSEGGRPLTTLPLWLAVNFAMPLADQTSLFLILANSCGNVRTECVTVG